MTRQYSIGDGIGAGEDRTQQLSKLAMKLSSWRNRKTYKYEALTSRSTLDTLTAIKSQYCIGLLGRHVGQGSPHRTERAERPRILRLSHNIPVKISLRVAMKEKRAAGARVEELEHQTMYSTIIENSRKMLCRVQLNTGRKSWIKLINSIVVWQG